MATLADALEALLKHSSIPHESEDRDAVQGFIDHQRGEDKPADKPATHKGGTK